MPATNSELTRRNAIVSSKSEFSKAAHLLRDVSVLELGDRGIFRAPEYIKSDRCAMSHFKRVVKLYKDFEFGSNADVHLIARYATAQSGYERVLTQQHDVNEQITSLDKQINDLGCKRLQSARDREEMKEWLTYKMDLFNSLGRLDLVLNRKSSDLLKLEDKLFLTPLSRAREVLPGVAKKNAAKGSKQEENPFLQAFGEV